MDTIKLHYLTHKDDGTEMTKFAFQKICAMFNWNTLAIQAFFKKAGWVFDDDYGFTFDEVITHMQASFPRDLGTHRRMTGFNEPCEGRR